MAKKKSKTTKTTQERVVFAFRLSPEQRDTIHQAAGPRGASRFVLEAALAAATGDKKAFAALISRDEK
jgi:uncharacterized protein (DUF1778 family)